MEFIREDKEMVDRGDEEDVYSKNNERCQDEDIRFSVDRKKSWKD